MVVYLLRDLAIGLGLIAEFVWEGWADSFSRRPRYVRFDGTAWESIKGSAALYVEPLTKLFR